MHRSTTIAALLVAVAVSALSGCVTVERPPIPGSASDSAPSRRAAARPDGSAGPRAVQAPAREALEMVGPSRHPGQPSPPRPPAAPPAAHRPPAAAAVPAAPTHPRPRPDHRRRPHGRVPHVPRPAPGAPDVCALGRTYGGWRGDSPESVICDRTYGH
ncbi:hypothetical protein [Streptomyces sp. NPDC051452]|uniref:hypothetical protein n=1 Tax=Streptomyces sp. NPDC051452 TaxID=3365654 RepID=UPI00379FFA26